MLFFTLTLLFFGLCNGIILDCTYKTEIWITIGNIYFCDVKVIRFNNTNRAVTGVSQNHLSGKSDSDVKGITFNNQPMNFIPRNLSKYFKNIQGLEIQSASLKAVSKDDLQQFPDLRLIYFYNNLLKTLEDDLFSYNPKLQHINFSTNKITKVGPNLLGSLKCLRQAEFSCNICIDQNAQTPSEIFDLTRNVAMKCPPTVESRRVYCYFKILICDFA
jgi:Leucine rich repeat